MYYGAKRVEKAIEVLLFLSKAGPSTLRTIAKENGMGRVGAYLFMSTLQAWNMASCGRTLHFEEPDPEPHILWRLTNGGRRFLKGWDELDERAPHAAFDAEP
jgi:hypothetical protein